MEYVGSEYFFFVTNYEIAHGISHSFVSQTVYELNFFFHGCQLIGNPSVGQFSTKINVTWSIVRDCLLLSISIEMKRKLTQLYGYNGRWGVSLSSAFNMAGNRIKLFQFIRKICQKIGAYPLQPNQSRYSINSKNWFHILCLNQFFISTTAYFFFEANSMVEYGMTFLISTANFVVSSCFLMAFLQKEKISNSVGNWEGFIEKSKS